MNKEIEVKKRDWVWKAGTIFFFLMLVLTLFSNTILNRSLPEVAAQYTESKTINARIRGSGTVTANEEYEVIAGQAYTVSEIPVKIGDIVEAGDVIIGLSKDASEELKTTKEDLHNAEVDLEKYMITAGSDSAPVSLHHAVVNARTELTAAQERLSLAQSRITQVENELGAFGYDADSYLELESRVNSAKAKVELRKTEEGIARRNFNTYVQTQGFSTATDDDSKTPAAPIDDDEYDRLQDILNNAVEDRARAENELDKLLIDTKFDVLVGIRERWDDAKKEHTDAGKAITTAQQTLSQANEALAEAQKADPLFDIEIREKNRTIDELKEKLAELEKEGALTEITAAVGGKITQINVSPGHKTDPEKPSMVIEIIDRGYTLSFPVTTEQSTRVRVGDPAKVDRGWWSGGEELTAVLSNIRPDPQNPAMGRLLVFTVTGENIDSGTQLNIEIAQKSENYGIVVPNSAIRTDTNGDFVLIVETRPSPLRNRYIATRVDVTVLAKDDTNSAISGAGLSGWDFVITTSTSPIEPGMQVRLVDNP